MTTFADVGESRRARSTVGIRPTCCGLLQDRFTSPSEAANVVRVTSRRSFCATDRLSSEGRRLPPASRPETPVAR